MCLFYMLVRKAAFTGIVRDNFSCFVCFDAEKITSVRGIYILFVSGNHEYLPVDRLSFYFHILRRSVNAVTEKSEE